MKVLLRGLVRALATLPTLRRPLRAVARAAMGSGIPALRYAGHGIAANVALADVASFSVAAPDGSTIAYGFCPEGNWVLRSLYWSGRHSFEPRTAEVFFERAKTARVVVDAGAHFGYYTYLAATAAPAAQVFAFEPIAELAERIAENTRRNGYHNVRVAAMALSNRNGQASFFINRDSPAMSGLDRRDDGNSTRIEVAVVRAADHLHAHGIDKVDLVKVDVEGHEQEVIEGMGDLRRLGRPDVICEVLPGGGADGDRRRELLRRRFADSGYECYWISPHGLVRESTVAGHPPFDANYLFTARGG